jgi:monovalent cation:H+ antiporter, CPA1 family
MTSGISVSPTEPNQIRVLELCRQPRIETTTISKDLNAEYKSDNNGSCSESELQALSIPERSLIMPTLLAAGLNLPILEDLLLLLLGAMLVAILTRRWRIPYTVGLVIAGATVGLLRHQGVLPSGGGHFELTEEVIFLVLLPPLLFEGAMNTSFQKLRENSGLIGTMALLGTLGVILITSAAIQAITGWSWEFALLLGAMVSPTDPVSVLAIFKEQGVEKKLSTIVEGESLFNDGLVVVLYFLLLRGIDQGWSEVSVPESILIFIRMVGLGALVGLSLGSLVNWILQRIDERMVEVLFSFLLAYGSYLIAERLESSGVIAVVFAGLMVGNSGLRNSMNATTQMSMGLTWEVVSFVANSIAFLALGFAVDPVLVAQNVELVIMVWLASVAARALMTYSIGGIDQSVRESYPRSWLHVIHWGGLKGAVPIALALGISRSANMQETAPTMQAVVAGVVMLSMLVQGTTIQLLLNKLGITKRLEGRRRWERHQARSIAVETALEGLTDIAKTTEIDFTRVESIRSRLIRIRETIHDDLRQVLEDHPEFAAEQVRGVMIRLLHRQRSAVEQAFREGILSEDALRDVQEEIDLLLIQELPAPVPGSPEAGISESHLDETESSS